MMIKAGLILKRAPVLLRIPTALDKISLPQHATPYNTAFMGKAKEDAEPIEYTSTEPKEHGLEKDLRRTLYCAMKQKDGRYAFPSTEARDSLKESAASLIDQNDASVFIVGNAPVAVHKEDESDNVTFMMKGQIFSGKVKGAEWFTKEELQKVMPPKYFDSVKDVLAE